MPVPHHSVFTGQMPFLLPNQQRQNTEGKTALLQVDLEIFLVLVSSGCIGCCGGKIRK